MSLNFKTLTFEDY